MEGFRVRRGGEGMRLLGNVRFMNRKAVSGVISGMFAVLIFFVAIAAIYSYHVMQDRYLQTVNERHQMDWERLNEKITIPYAERLEDGTLNATVQNIGAVATHLVALWVSAYDGSGEPQWQRQHSIDVWVDSGESKHNLGQSDYSYFLIKPGETSETLTSIQLPDAGWTYVIKIVTERGNVSIYTLQPTIEEGEGGGGVGPAHIGWLAITFQPNALMYTGEGRAIAVSVWNYAISDRTEGVVWFINITNLGFFPITMHEDCKLRVMAWKGSGGSFTMSHVGEWYISEPPSAVPPGWYYRNPEGVPGYDEINDPQIISPGEWEWVAFGAEEPGASHDGNNPPPSFSPGSSLDNEVWLFLVTYYEYNGQDYTQIIPFASIKYTSS